MTKAEIIRKIAKRAGVPDTEAKVFFEIFLKKSSDQLKPGEAIFLNGFGHFQLRKGKIRKSPSETEDHDSVFIELMVYYPVSAPEGEISEEIVFNVPAIEYGNYNPLDSHFSLSIGRPVIPIQGVSSPDFFIPLTGLELRKLIEGRADRLLKDIEVVKEYTKGNEVLIIDTETIKSHQLEFNWNEVQSKNISDSNLTAKSKEVKVETIEAPEKEIAWDLNDNLDKEIVEDSILDIEKERNSIVEDEYEEEISGDKTDWNFGITMAEEEPAEPFEKIADEEKQIEQNGNLGESKKEKTQRLEQSLTSEIESDNEEQFERVRSFTSYLEKNENENFPDDSIYKSLRRTDAITFDKLEPDTRVNEEELNKRIRIEDLDYLKFEEEKKLPSPGGDIIADEKSKTGNENNSEASLGSIGAISSSEEVKSSTKTDFISRREEREAYYSRGGASPVFIIAIIIIIAIAVALYFYLNHAFVSSKIPEPGQVAASKVIHPNIVERDFTVPVTYTNKNEVSGTETNSESIKKQEPDEVKAPVVVNKPFQKKESKKEENNTIASSFSFSNLPAPVDTAELHKNISFENGNYTVQVSSFKTKSIADQQLSKFKKKGYNAFVERASVPGRGTWYRVKVKDFKTMREAENFLLSNK